MRARWSRLSFLPLLIALAANPEPSAAAPDLIVLRETGQTQDSLPVFQSSPRGAEVTQVLSRGFSETLLRLYRLEQEYLARKEGRPARPAALLLSHRQGGFPCRGYVLDGQVLRDGDYVDLHQKSSLVGSFGSMDQIYPHELAHVMVRQLVGEMKPGGSSQVHAVGVCTDPVTAFSEGLAEHMQIMALEDPEADLRTKALLSNHRQSEWAARALDQYRRELSARLAWFAPRRTAFLLWFSRAEQIERYYQVKDNLFAHQATLPGRLLRGSDPFRAYLLDNVLPGRPADPPKSRTRMVSTEGVVSCFFYRWATSAALRNAYRDGGFYQQFGVTQDQVSPEENVYLKLIHAFYLTKPQTTQEAVAGYKQTFPEDGPAVDVLVRDTFLGDLPPVWASIWLADAGVRTGTSLFDQFRSLPRVHLFDLNTAGPADLAAVRGMTPGLAAEIIGRQPLAGLAQLAAVPGMSPDLVVRFGEMAAKAESMRSGMESREEAESHLSLTAIVKSYLWRALWAIGIATLLGGVLSRLIRRRGWLVPLLNGLGAALVGLPAAWLTARMPAVAVIVAVLIVFGLPAVIWTVVRTRSRRKALRSLVIWVVAAIPAAILVTAWF